MRDARVAAMGVAALTFVACSGGTAPREPSSTPGEATVVQAAPPMVPVPPASVEPASAPAALPEASAWPAEPSSVLVGGGCETTEPITIAPRASSIAIAATPRGALLAYAERDQVTLQPLGEDGHVAGEASTIEIANLGALLGLARLGSGLVLVGAAGCTERGWRRSCLVAAPLDASGHATGARAMRELEYETLRAAPDWDQLAERGPILVASPNASAVWVVSAFDTSHMGEGVHVERIVLGPDGAAEVGTRHTFADDLPDGASLMGFRASATDDELVVLFGARSDYEQPPVGVRYLARFSDHSTVHVGDLGNVVHDVVLDAGDIHVLFDRRTSYFTTVVDRTGQVGEAMPLDRTQPLPAPFTTHVLVELAGPADHPQRVLHDASGRRLGNPIPQGPLAWTSGHLLVASTDTDGARVWPLTCRAP